MINKIYPAIIIRRKEVEVITGLSRSTIYDRMNSKSPRYDKTFPTPISLGARAVGWYETDILNWLASREEVRP